MRGCFVFLPLTRPVFGYTSSLPDEIMPDIPYNFVNLKRYDKNNLSGMNKHRLHKVIETSTANVFLRENDVVVVEYKPDVEVKLEDMIAIHDAERKLTHEKKHVALLDARGFVYVSDDAKKFGASEVPAHYRKAAALLVDSLAVRMLGNFYLNFNKPKVPTKMFSNEKKAIDWLKSQ